MLYFQCDRGGIQTLNLLIRSQMLYSVKLRSHFCFASANIEPLVELNNLLFSFFWILFDESSTKQQKSQISPNVPITPWIAVIIQV